MSEEKKMSIIVYDIDLVQISYYIYSIRTVFLLIEIFKNR